jgi:indole-3-glycerol phosphate synthase
LTTYLDDIVRHKRRHRHEADSDLEGRVTAAPPARSLVAGAGTYRALVIAECKKASPSKGLLVDQYDPVNLARAYESAGAAAISVLTDESFFQGSLMDLVKVRAVVEVPVLRKDFTLYETDLLVARAAGADLILLIARILSDAELRHLLSVANDLGMEAIVEVHDEVDVNRALEAGSLIVGINNRDLSTFQTDIRVTERLLPLIPSDIAVISESGITSPDQVHRLQQAGARGVLIGEALLREGDPAALLRELVNAGCPDCWASPGSRERAIQPAGG